ncbi:hypothetical protein AKJ51_02725 [candidate division MSBL1 archaeon SCGC-AAA382A20]|uniref:Uncharacterized protein n=1 Tax=candidate division MSBL1 archaeon SCGC-AAA382A20 TaxID=1698280 RepID=A0A133VK77_9EURY|nr:hypothetical protein AKJ51_02725 [candidate division MSBL1 archaeon SCGC-AAA382A20]
MSGGAISAAEQTMEFKMEKDFSGLDISSLNDNTVLELFSNDKISYLDKMKYFMKNQKRQTKEPENYTLENEDYKEIF